MERCHYCAHRVYTAKTQHAAANPARVRTLDHITPKCMGGTKSRSNVVVACAECNNIRSDAPYEVYFTFSKVNSNKLHGVARRNAFREFMHEMAILGVNCVLDRMDKDNSNQTGSPCQT